MLDFLRSHRNGERLCIGRIISALSALSARDKRNKVSHKSPKPQKLLEPNYYFCAFGYFCVRYKTMYLL